MGFHHVALATRDTEATHHFYTEVMGFELVKVVTAANPGDHGGFSKHFFYDTSGAVSDETSGAVSDETSGAVSDETSGAVGGSADQGMIAFWEIHDSEIGSDFPVDINASAGLPWWVNHIAFDAPTQEALDAHRERWQRHGHKVLEVDHEFCVSIYIRDPSNNMVEFCHTTRPFTTEEKVRAFELLADPHPPLEKNARVRIHEPIGVDVPEPVAGG